MGKFTKFLRAMVSRAVAEIFLAITKSTRSRAENTVFFDANVLYPAPLRDFLLRIAKNAKLRARWTDKVHEEWISALLRNNRNLGRCQLEQSRRLMDSTIPNCLVEGYEKLLPALTRTNQNDRHVLAASICCCAAVLVTRNLRHFPYNVLGKYKIRAQSPDNFISELMGRDLGVVVKTAREHRDRLRIEGYPKTVDEYLDTLKRNGLKQVVNELSRHKGAL